MCAFALVSQSALAHNIAIVNQKKGNAKIVSVVKANAYGHHIDLIDPIINSSDLLAVSLLAEAYKLRKKTNKPILLLGGVNTKDELEEANKLNCHIVVCEHQQVAIIKYTKKAINIWIKVDTGMHRLGLLENEYHQCIKLFNDNKLINIDCIMSHLACADDIKHPMNTAQLNKFKQLVSGKNKLSVANSAMLLWDKVKLFDFVRPGIMLYGISPFGKPDKRLKPVMKLSASIKSIKIIKKGETVGYGATWIATKKTTIAIISIGYGDGYPRHAKNGTPVLVNNTVCSLVGRVSMDLICVDISNVNAKVNDIVILWGDDKLAVETVASYSNTIAYELVSKITARVAFSKTL